MSPRSPAVRARPVRRSGSTGRSARRFWPHGHPYASSTRTTTRPTAGMPQAVRVQAMSSRSPHITSRPGARARHIPCAVEPARSSATEPPRESVGPPLSRDSDLGRCVGVPVIGLGFAGPSRSSMFDLDVGTSGIAMSCRPIPSLEFRGRGWHPVPGRGATELYAGLTASDVPVGKSRGCFFPCTRCHDLKETG